MTGNGSGCGRVTRDEDEDDVEGGVVKCVWAAREWRYVVRVEGVGVGRFKRVGCCMAGGFGVV